jgi:selenocysteine lyase/cysteine desulfurase
VRHPLDLAREAQALGFDVLIDAAGAGVCGGLSLSRHPVQFVALSFYKVFGLPTGVGALVARRDALAELARPWFAGGTVDFVFVEHDRHRLSAGHAGFEDGTPNFLDLAALQTGFDFIAGLDLPALQLRLATMTTSFIRRAQALTHRNGQPVVQLYGPSAGEDRGAVVSFNILRPDGRVRPYQDVEERAKAAGVALRGGCFCNPGAAERAFGFSAQPILPNLDALGAGFSIPALQARLGDRVAVGAVRVSLGLPTTEPDLACVLRMIAGFCD